VKHSVILPVDLEIIEFVTRRTHQVPRHHQTVYPLSKERINKHELTTIDHVDINNCIIDCLSDWKDVRQVDRKQLVIECITKPIEFN